MASCSHAVVAGCLGTLWFRNGRLRNRTDCPPMLHLFVACEVGRCVSFWGRALFIAGGHTASNAPDPFRPPKLSGAGPGWYWGGGPPGKTPGCCQLLVWVGVRSGVCVLSRAVWILALICGPGRRYPRFRADTPLAGIGCFQWRRFVASGLGGAALSIAGGHTASNAPDLFRPPKLSGAGPG